MGGVPEGLSRLMCRTITTPPIIQLVSVWLVVLGTADGTPVLVAGELIFPAAGVAGCGGWLEHN